ncbi:hypothetical protein HY522_03420 [bacterium]|nr:hypothetical protein [bacterium]
MTVSLVDRRFRLGLQRLIAQLDDKESFRLVQADLGDTDQDIRAGAVRLIGELGLKEFLPNILEHLQKMYGRQPTDEERNFTVAVLDALESIGDTPVAEDICRRFEQLADGLKPAALYVIAAHGAGSDVIDGFFRGLMRVDTPYPDLRAPAVSLFGRLIARPTDPPGNVLAPLRQLLMDPDQPVRAAAVDALSRVMGERVFELPEYRAADAGVRTGLIRSSPAVPTGVLEDALKSDSSEVQGAAAQRVLSVALPTSVIRDVLRIYCAGPAAFIHGKEEPVVTDDRLTRMLGRWVTDKTGRLVVIQAVLSLLRRQTGVLDKFKPSPGSMVGEMDRTLAQLRRAIFRSGSTDLSAALLNVLSGKLPREDFLRAVRTRCRSFPSERELGPVMEEILAVEDERIRKRIATEVRLIPAGAFIPIKRLLKILPPIREQSLVVPLRHVRDMAKAHSDGELEWQAVIHLAGCGEGISQAAVCEAIRKGDSADVSAWIRGLTHDTEVPKVRQTLLHVIERSTRAEPFRAAVELLTAKPDAAVSNLLMKRLPDLRGALRFVVIQAIGRMGDRVHLPVFLKEMRAPEEDRKLAALLGLEKLLDANADLPPDAVSPQLYDLKDHKSSMVQAAAVGLLTRLKDPNRVDLVAGLIGSESSIPVGAYRLVEDLCEEDLPDDSRHALFQALLSRIGRMREEEDAVVSAFKAVMAGRRFSDFLKPRRQRADAAEDLKTLLRRRPAAKAQADFQISKSLRRMAIAFLDIAGFTPRAARMTVIELGMFLVQVEDEIMPFVKKHAGRLVKRLGDGFLVAYETSSAAVGSCLEILLYLAKKNQILQEDDRVRFRAGIHVGDVLIDRDDIFGDTVNTAARVEAVARPMCICLTEAVHREMQSKNDAVEWIGPTRLKGKDAPVTLYRIRLDVIYEAQTVAIEQLMAAPDWPARFGRFEAKLDDRARRVKEKIEEARSAVARGDHAHAEVLAEEIEKLLL